MGEMAVNFVFLSGKNSFYSGRMYIQWGQKGKEGVGGKGAPISMLMPASLQLFHNAKHRAFVCHGKTFHHLLMHLLSLKVILFLALRK